MTVAKSSLDGSRAIPDSPLDSHDGGQEQPRRPHRTQIPHMPSRPQSTAALTASNGGLLSLNDSNPSLYSVPAAAGSPTTASSTAATSTNSRPYSAAPKSAAAAKFFAQRPQHSADLPTLRARNEINMTLRTGIRRGPELNARGSLSFKLYSHTTFLVFPLPGRSSPRLAGTSFMQRYSGERNRRLHDSIQLRVKGRSLSL